MRNKNIESLMVIGFNPSHSNINSEVNAPFKILSILLRFLEAENNPKKGKRKEHRQDEEEKVNPSYKFKKDY